MMRDNYLVQFSDNIFESSAALKYFRAKADIQGGDNIVKTPILYAETKAKGSVKGFGTMNINPNEQFTKAIYTYVRLYVSITVSKDEEDYTSGDLGVMRMIEAKMKAAELSLTKLLSQGMISDGSDANYPHGVRKIINIDRSLGGINSTTEPWWDGNVLLDTTNFSKANLINPESDYYILKVLRHYWNKAKHNNDHPDIIVCSQGWEDCLEEEVGPYQRYINDSKGDVTQANVEFADFTYKKKAPFLVDDIVSDEAPGELYMLNSDWIDITFHEKGNFFLDSFIRPANIAGRVAQIFVVCQFTCRGPRMLSRIQANSDIEPS